MLLRHLGTDGWKTNGGSDLYTQPPSLGLHTLTEERESGLEEKHESEAVLM